jgi:hypothetical protein
MLVKISVHHDANVKILEANQMFNDDWKTLSAATIAHSLTRLEVSRKTNAKLKVKVTIWYKFEMSLPKT